MATVWKKNLTASEWAIENQRHRLVTLVLTLTALAIMGSLLLLMQTARVAALSHEVRQLHQAKEDWHQRNAQLEAEIASLASLQRIEKEARDHLGMVPAENHFYVPVERVHSAPEQIRSQFPLGNAITTIELQDSFWLENLLRGLNLPAEPE